MSKTRLSHLHTALQVLSDIDHPVPKDLLSHISSLIKEQEAEKQERRMTRMSDEQLEKYQSRIRRRLRVTTADGRIIQMRTNLPTFFLAIRESKAVPTLLCSLHIGKKALAIYAPNRKFYPSYQMIAPGLFVYKKLTTSQMVEVLEALDRQLHLNWEIELL